MPFRIVMRMYGNAFMKLPDPDSIAELNEFVDKEFGDVLLEDASEVEDGVPIAVVLKRRLAVNKSGTAYIKLPTEAEVRKMEQKVRAEYPDVFSDELPNKMPLAGGPKHLLSSRMRRRSLRTDDANSMKYSKAFK